MAPGIKEWFAKLKYMGLHSKLSAMCKCRAGQLNALENFTKAWTPLLTSWEGIYQDNMQEKILSIL